MQDIATVITALAALGGLVLSVAAFVSMRRMRQAEAQEKEAKARTEETNRQRLEDEITERVLARANAENKRLEERVTQVEAEFNDLLRGAWALHKQLKDNDIEPDYYPPRRLTSQAEQGDTQNLPQHEHRPPPKNKTSGFGVR